MNPTSDILIVEDDEILRDLYLRKFRSDSYTVRTAVNGEDALQKIEEKKPDLMLLDVNMPVMDGFTMLSKLTAEQRTFPVIVLTNFDDQANRSKGAELKVTNYFVKKDMTIKALVEMAGKALEKAKA